MSPAPKSFFAPLKRRRHDPRHSRRVARLRVALPVAAGLILAAVFLWPLAAGRQRIDIPPVTALPQLTMEQPRFSGTDDQNQPYAFTAKRATQMRSDAHIIDLEAPEAQMTLQNDVPVSGSARLGRLDQANKRLWLGGDVALKTAKGERFSTSELFVDMGQRTVWGDKPAAMTGDFGTIEGQGFRIYDGGKVVLFTGQSRAILNPGASITPPAAMIEKK